MLPTLESKNLILRPLRLTDADAIFEYAKDPIVSKYTLWESHLTIKDSESFISNYALPNYQKNIPEPFGLCHKSDPEKVIGTGGCFWVSQDNHIMELGYALSPISWGQGLIVEASKVIIDYIFKNYQVRRLQCRCNVEHRASARVMEKLSMNYEGILRQAIFHRNQYWDMKYYSLIK